MTDERVPTTSLGAMSDPTATDLTALDLDTVERDLAGVEAALNRLDAGTYWTDEVTGQPIDAAVLEADPTARRNP